MWPFAYGSAAVTRIFRSDIRTLRWTFPLTDSKHPQDITIGVKPECRKSCREIAGDSQVEITLHPFHFPCCSSETWRRRAEFDPARLFVPNLPALPRLQPMRI